MKTLFLFFIGLALSIGAYANNVVLNKTTTSKNCLYLSNNKEIKTSNINFSPKDNSINAILTQLSAHYTYTNDYGDKISFTLSCSGCSLSDLNVKAQQVINDHTGSDGHFVS